MQMDLRYSQEISLEEGTRLDLVGYCENSRFYYK
jgi:hypothetical protein